MATLFVRTGNGFSYFYVVGGALDMGTAWVNDHNPTVPPSLTTAPMPVPFWSSYLRAAVVEELIEPSASMLVAGYAFAGASACLVVLRLFGYRLRSAESYKTVLVSLIRIVSNTCLYVVIAAGLYRGGEGVTMLKTANATAVSASGEVLFVPRTYVLFNANTKYESFRFLLLVMGGCAAWLAFVHIALRYVVRRPVRGAQGATSGAPGNVQQVAMEVASLSAA